MFFVKNFYEREAMSETLPLKDFIVSTLTSICDAVEEVRREKRYVAFQHAAVPEHAKSTLIEFDLAVTITASNASEDSATGKAGISVFGIGALIKGEAQGKEESSNTLVNRIHFNVPVDFRLDEKKYEKIQDAINKPLKPTSRRDDRI